MTGASERAEPRLSGMLNTGVAAPARRPAVSLEPLHRAVARIEARWPDAGPPDEKDRERLVRKMKMRLELDEWQGCRLSFVAAAAHALFDPERRSRSDLSNLRDFYYRETAVSDRAPLLSAMLMVFVDSFDPGAAHTDAIAAALREARSRIPARGRRLVEAVPELLDPEKVADTLAQRMRGVGNPYEILRGLGVKAPHAPGLMDHVHLRYVDLVAPDLGQDTTADGLLTWLRPEGLSARRTGAAEAITALLRPWLRRDPGPDRLTFLTHRLVDMYGDPRRMSGAPWHNVGAAERAVFLRWLTGENLRLLFDVISDTNESHMWAERRRFYLSLHEQKRIDALWVAFAPAAARRARQIMADSGHGTAMEFGRQVSKASGRSNTSLLIAKIGSKILVDGSHSYKVHMFGADDPNAPKLFEKTYDCERIRWSLDERNKTSHHGGWQNWVLMRI